MIQKSDLIPQLKWAIPTHTYFLFISEWSYQPLSFRRTRSSPSPPRRSCCPPARGTCSSRPWGWGRGPGTARTALANLQGTRSLVCEQLGQLYRPVNLLMNAYSVNIVLLIAPLKEFNLWVWVVASFLSFPDKGTKPLHSTMHRNCPTRPRTVGYYSTSQPSIVPSWWSSWNPHPALRGSPSWLSSRKAASAARWSQRTLAGSRKPPGDLFNKWIDFHTELK